jgi:hypothetical protein
LSAHQQGDGVQLTFTMPVKTVTGDRLTQPPAVEILRGALKPDGSVDAKSFRVVSTIPGALASNFRAEDHVQVLDPVVPGELHTYPGDTLVYRVRSRASRKRPSADSNPATIHISPVAKRIDDLHAEVVESAVHLRWTPPMLTSAGAPLGAVAEYRVYRGEVDSASADAAAKDIFQAKWKAPLALLGSATTGEYSDALFDFGKTYLYVVRSVTSPAGAALESSDSTPAIVAPRDIFPPAAPQGLVAAVIVGSPTNAPEVDLSWSMNVESDLAGYRVYRSEQQDTPGTAVTPDQLLSPAYRDTSVQAGHRYWYSVTAVDRSGNESAPTAPVVAEVTQPSS